jgi:hypothetical protein
MEIKEYKCPNCGGAKKFDSSSQNMKCPYCDTEFEIAALEEYQKELNSNAEDRFDWGKEIDNVQGSKAEAWDDPEQDCLSTGSCPPAALNLSGIKIP